MKIETLKEKIYYSNLILLMIKIYYSISDIFHIPNILSKIITFYIILSFCITLFLKIIDRNKNYTFLKKVTYCIIFILCIYSSYIADDYNIVLSYFLIIGIEDVDLKKVLKIIFRMNILFIAIHIIAYCINLGLNFMEISTYYTSTNEIRYNCFLGHPNEFSIILFSTYSIYIYLQYENLHFYHYLYGLALCAFIYFVPKSRTSAIITMIFMILIFLSKLNKSFINYLLKWIAKYLFPVLSILTLIFLTQFNKFDDKTNEFLGKVDTLLSGRIWYSERTYEEYGSTLLGQRIEYDEETLMYNRKPILDNLYVKCIINYGIIYLLLISLWFGINNKIMSTKQYVYIIVFAIIGICETHIINACIGIILLIVGSMGVNKNLYLKP